MTFDSIISQSEEYADINIGEGMEYSTNYAKSFSDENFGTDIKGLRDLFADGSLPSSDYYEINGHVFAKGGREAAGSAVFHSSTKTTDVYLFKMAFISKEELYLVMGHEYLHAGFNALGYVGKHELQHIGIYKWEYAQAQAWNYRLDFYGARYSQVAKYRGLDYTKLGFYVLPINIF